ncbi:hypothetical protein [Schumannella sp. 10F1B-5-1]|uniref:hypothetical protein n=1 Tax=Schumannella sp. 10F1B-5-1 TaxID=2590780 RepID=UPI001131E0B6|nr:hypothetical protein [Schumannella sp. 10F1B-5-1]TPW70929.1 hypothetical protein FJ658_12565 [Schumannella sp. 10F1B-5-1]
MDQDAAFDQVATALRASSIVWDSAGFTTAFPDGFERIVSGIVHTIGPERIEWIESRFLPDSPKAQAIVLADGLVLLAVMTPEGFGLHVRPLHVEALSVTATPLVHPVGHGGGSVTEESVFRFSAAIDGLDQVEFPWQPETSAQLERLSAQYQRMLARLR